ncbi:decarboxylase [Candidatus Woesearchaeota archaeon]|nr:decarboxylase [Candidatus Woesearchaeota archaeon]
MEAKFILNKRKAIEQLEIVKELADEVSYSFKTNNEVGKILEGKCLFSVHSFEDLSLIKDKSKVWYFPQAWNKELVTEILKEEVNSFVIDNENDLKVLLENTNKEINLLLRMKLKEHTIHTGKYFVFGFNSEKINKLLPELRRNKKIKKLGIHFHRKTQNVSEWSLKEEFIDNISNENLKNIDLINIGGGLPAEYKNYRKEVINNIFFKISELRKFLNSKNIKMAIEPGRFIAAPAVKLECEIISVYDNNITVNCSVYNSDMDVFVANVRLLVENELEKGEGYTIKGCTPDSMDIFRYNVFLKKPKAGDKIVFLNAGAYNFSSNYFNLPKIKTVVE